MICFDNRWQTMERKGVSTYTLREKCGMDGKTVCRLRADENIETKTLSRLCAALDCTPAEIAEYVEDGCG